MELKSQVEVEAKFSVTSDTVVPDLTTIMGVEQIVSTKVHHLSAVYYDTEDLRLTRSKITLRRRTGARMTGGTLSSRGKLGGWRYTTPLIGAQKYPRKFIRWCVRLCVMSPCPPSPR